MEPSCQGANGTNKSNIFPVFMHGGGGSAGEADAGQKNATIDKIVTTISFAGIKFPYYHRV
jgi:hypothetical protein